MTWQSLGPRIGGKTAFAGQVAAVLHKHNPEFIFVPYAGLLKELMQYEGDAKVVCGEADRDIKSLLLRARSGGLQRSVHLARAYVENFLSSDPELLKEQWKDLRLCRLPLQAPEKTLILLAGHISGIWRRNKRGELNVSPGRYDKEWILSRMMTMEQAEEADAWAREHLWLVHCTDSDVLHDMMMVATRPSVLICDPPFGVEQTAVYGDAWAPQDAHALAKAGQALWESPDHDLKAIIAWSDEDGRAAWEKHIPAMSWEHIEKSKRQIGARVSPGFHYGVAER